MGVDYCGRGVEGARRRTVAHRDLASFRAASASARYTRVEATWCQLCPAGDNIARRG